MPTLLSKPALKYFWLLNSSAEHLLITSYTLGDCCVIVPSYCKTQHKNIYIHTHTHLSSNFHKHSLKIQNIFYHSLHLLTQKPVLHIIAVSVLSPCNWYLPEEIKHVSNVQRFLCTSLLGIFELFHTLNRQWSQDL